jgi:hypothetical protein
MEIISCPRTRITGCRSRRRRRIISVPQAAEIKGVSPDTFKRHYSHLIKKLSPRRNGCELGEVIDA